MKLALMAIALMASSAVAAADDKPPIKPFASVDWNDDFGTIVAKYNTLDGIAKCVVRAGRYELSCRGAKTAAQGTAVLSALMKKAALGPNPKARAQEFDANFAKAEVQGGKIIRHFEHEITATLETVVIEGMTFRLVATFAACPGFVVTDPRRVLVVASQPTITEPLILRNVELVPDGGKTSQEARNAMRDKLEQKYGDLKARRRAPNDEEPYAIDFHGGPFYERRDGECKQASDKLEELKAKRSSGGKRDSGEF